MTTSKYRPIMKPEMHRPLAPSGTCGDSSRPSGAFLRCLGKGENKCFPNKYRDNPYYIQKIRGNSNLSVIFTGGVVKTTKIGIEIVAAFVYNYLIVVQGT